MTTVYVREQGAVVRTRGERMIVTKGKDKLMDLPLLQLEQLAVVGNIQLTSAAVSALLARDVDVVFYSSRFRYRGRLQATGSKFAQLRHAQLQALGNEAGVLRLARPMVAGKLANQRVLLLRRRSADVAAAARDKLDAEAAGLGRMLAALDQATTLDSLRGYEGKGAAHYFAGLKLLIDPAWGFTGRQYYPPPDPVNALLSFGYGLLLRDAIAAVQLVGLDPFIGFLHNIDYGRPSLALDVMEEMRPLVVDSLVLGLLGRAQVAPADFLRTGRAERPIELSPAAVERYLRAYEERMAGQVTHPVSRDKVSYRRCLELQVRQVAAMLLGKAETYVPLTMR